ncbi:MAG: type II toxin-antitoxin system VapC family toxin [Solirubrobacteraceae bacterium]|jgi:PIN domain nuclease of toxin-antitoxin system
MAERVSAVLDASALLAYLADEPGADTVADAIAAGVAMSIVNVAEVLRTLAGRGHDPAKAAQDLTERGLLDGAITIEPLPLADAVEIARLRPRTRAAGLSLGDRACLALARRLSVQTLTADQAWVGAELGVDVVAIRPASA